MRKKKRENKGVKKEKKSRQWMIIVLFTLLGIAIGYMAINFSVHISNIYTCLHNVDTVMNAVANKSLLFSNQSWDYYDVGKTIPMRDLYVTSMKYLWMAWIKTISLVLAFEAVVAIGFILYNSNKKINKNQTK